MTYQSWTHAEEEALRVLAPLGCKACAEAFDRSESSTWSKAHHLGVRFGGRKSLARDLHDGAHGPAVLRRIQDALTAALCPACAMRWIGVAKTGLCGPCHLEALTRIHEEAIATADQQRALWAARSKLRRRRKSLAEMQDQ